MLLRFAKVAGGLRLLITEAGPIVATSVALLSARTAAYLVGFGLANILSSWLPIVASLVMVTGLFNAGSNSAECEAYRAQMRAIDEANRALMETYQIIYESYLVSFNAYNIRYTNALKSLAPSYDPLIMCAGSCRGNGVLCSGCYQSVSIRYYIAVNGVAGDPPTPPPSPAYQSYPACSSPNCPPGKKVWTQVLWASPSGNASEPKGCFIVAFSQDAPTLAPEIEYNPFLPDAFVKSQAISYYLVNGDRYRDLQDNQWENLESVQGWDKGYWRSEATDPECRGWRPGWSKIIK